MIWSDLTDSKSRIFYDMVSLHIHETTELASLNPVHMQIVSNICFRVTSQASPNGRIHSHVIQF